MILHGNCLDVIKDINDETVDVVISSPPYYKKRKYFAGNNEIGTELSFQDYINNLRDIFVECYRILKRSGNMFIVVGDYYDKQTHSLVGIPEFLHVKLAEAGLYRRHRIIWVKPNGKINASEIYKRMHLNHEIILHYVKTTDLSELYFKVPKVRLADSTIKEYQAFYTGKAKTVKSEYEKHGQQAPSDMKRNINASIQRRFAPFGGKKNVRAKENPSHIYSGNEYVPSKELTGIDSSVWTITHETSYIPHYAIFPKKLITKLIESSCPEGGICFDPFMGSGTLALVALQMGRKFIGIELNEDYIKLCKERLLPILQQKKLWM